MTYSPRVDLIRAVFTLLFFSCLMFLAGANAQSLRLAPGADLASPEANPRAHAGVAQTAIVGERVTLDGTASVHPAGRALSWNWSLDAPAGSGAALSDPNAVRPQFTLDLVGDYVATLVVADGKNVSAPSAVRISTGNVAPVAKAAPQLHADVGQAVVLDAAASTDANGDVLSYAWRLIASPDQSVTQPAVARAARTTFVPDAPGDYLFSVVANDGRLDSAPATVRLSTARQPLVADAGDDQIVAVGRQHSLESQTPGTWSLLHAPSESAAVRRTDQGNTLSIDAAGLYVAQLAVSDEHGQQALDTRVIEARNLSTLPVASSANRGGLDVDGDGVPDDIDNCVDVANPTQLDTNGDGFGNACDADIDNDGFITNFGDLGLLRLAFFSNPSTPNWNPDADFNGDNIVNFIDLGIMRSYFFGPPGPIALRFTNPAGGSWHDPANWTPPVVPTTVHTVRIDLDPGVIVEYSTGTSEIAGLRASSPVLISGGELSIAGDAQFNAGLTLDGATLANANILTPATDPAPSITVPTFTTGGLDNVTLGGELTLETGATVNVEGDLFLNDGVVRLISDNNFTNLRFNGPTSGTSVFGGTGTVLFDGGGSVDGRNRVLAQGVSHTLIIEPGITIAALTRGGEISHQSSNGTLLMRGQVLSDLDGRLTTLRGRPLIVEGTLAVSNNSRLLADSASVGGLLTSAANVTVDDAELELFGQIVNEASIPLNNAILDLGRNANDRWSNDGTVTAVNSIIEFGGVFTQADVGTMTGTGTSRIDGRLDNTGETLDVGALFPGTTELATSGSILGGTIAVTPLTLPRSTTFTLDGVTLATDLDIEPVSSMNIDNGLTLDNATVSLNSDNNFCTLSFSGSNGDTSVLGGVGEVVFNGTSTVDGRNRVRAVGTNHTFIVDSGVTVRSGTSTGELSHASTNPGPLTVRGPITSSIDGRRVVLRGAPLNIDTTINVTNDALVQANFGNTGSTISAGSTITVNTGELELFGDFTNLGAINIVDSTLDLGNVAADEWNNGGVITLTNSTLELGGTYAVANLGTINGNGQVILNGTLLNDGQMFDLGSIVGGNVLLNTGGSIVGGTVIGTTLNVPSNQTFTLDGVTLAADANLDPSATLTIANGLTLDSSTVRLLSNNNFVSLNFIGASGEVSVLGGTGEVLFSGTATVNNRNRVRVSSGGHGLTVAPGVTIRSDTAGGEVRQSSNNGPIRLQGDVVANVAGRGISLGGAPLIVEGALSVSNDSVATLNGFGEASTIASSATVSVSDSELELFGDITNEANIMATNGIVDLGTLVTDEWVNAGTITLTTSRVELGGSFDIGAVGTIVGSDTLVIDGVLDNVGQTLDVDTQFPLTPTLETGGRIVGGSVTGSPLTIGAFENFGLENVTLGADLAVEGGGTLSITDDVTLDGATISLESDNNFTSLSFLAAADDVMTLGGIGNVVFNGTATVDSRNRITTSVPGDTLVVEAGVSIASGTAGGELRHTGGAMIIQGAVTASLPGRLVSVQAAPLTFEGSAQVSNDGEFRATFSSTSSAPGLASALSTLSANTGEIELFGDVTLAGTVTLTDALLDLGNSVNDNWVNTGSIALTNSDIEAGGTVSSGDFGSITRTGTGASVFNAAMDLTGETIDLGTLLPPPILFGANGSLTGGTLTTTPLSMSEFVTFTFDGVTLATDMSIALGSTLNVNNGLTLANATIRMLSNNNFSSLTFAGASGEESLFAGTGSVIFDGTATVDGRNRVLVTGTMHSLDIAPGITISTGTASGEIRQNSNNGSITMRGDLVSNLPGRSLRLFAAPFNLEGTLTVDAGSDVDAGNYSVSGAATVNLGIGGTATADQGRILAPNVDAALDGTLNVSLANGFTPVLGDTFVLSTFGSLTGTYSTINVPALGGGLVLTPTYNAGDLTFTVTN
ncbi:MAG: thrombospondin type 3 repeat-containing protein [Gammaproteobacteria bacterium]